MVPRSWLFTPGSRPDRFAKAAATAADALILDLEDAVAEEAKPEARANVIAYLSARPDIRQQICIRINPLGRAAGIEDLAALARLGTAGPAMVMIPKAEDAGDLRLAAKVLDDQESPARLVALVESAIGVAGAATLAQATPRLVALLFGGADYAADLGQQVGTFVPEFARGAIVNAAAGAGIAAIDTPFFAVDRPDALAAECQRSRAMGFWGKAAIHPAQLDAIGEAFAVAAADVALAERILAAAPDGVGVIDGKMIDIAMIRWARRVVPSQRPAGVDIA